MSVKAAMVDIHRQYWRFLMDTHKSVSVVAKAAGCSRETVYRMLHKFGLTEYIKPISNGK